MASSKKLVIAPKKYRGTTAVVSARLPADLIDAIDRAAKNTGYNRNEILEKCLIFAIENMETGEGGN
ncbi:MAG: ribbon-helix-helix protein, CopG family [Lachnospiraceae bacterium]|nr:ribbon-helix-helix protein, CopG family [Lachnospiraceae bacterium]